MFWTRLYDPSRTPAHWSKIICEGEYSVFFLNADNRTPRDLDGRQFSEGEESVAICRDLDEAAAFGHATVARHPELCAEIYDHEGKSGEPLRVVYEPSVRGRYTGRPYAKREAMQGGLIVSLGMVFIAFDIHRDLTWMWGYILGAKLVLVGGSFLVRGIAGLYEHRA
jgi:hypothetical protein